MGVSLRRKVPQGHDCDAITITNDRKRGPHAYKACLQVFKTPKLPDDAVQIGFHNVATKGLPDVDAQRRTMRKGHSHARAK